MDANKLKVLQEIGYKIQPTCGSCEAGVFADPKSEFGSCVLYTYDHQKHSGADRQLSINRYGCCPEYERDPRTLGPLGAWSQFCTEV